MHKINDSFYGKFKKEESDEEEEKEEEKQFQNK